MTTPLSGQKLGWLIQSLILGFMFEMPFRKDTLHFTMSSKIYQTCQGGNEGPLKNWNFYHYMNSATDVGLFLKANQSIILASVWQRGTLRGLFLNSDNQLSESWLFLKKILIVTHLLCSKCCIKCFTQMISFNHFYNVMRQVQIESPFYR